MSNISDARSINHARIVQIDTLDWVQVEDESDTIFRQKISLKWESISPLRVEESEVAESSQQEGFFYRETNTEEATQIEDESEYFQTGQDYVFFHSLGAEETTQENPMDFWAVSLNDERYPEIINDINEALLWLEKDEKTRTLPEQAAIGPFFAEVLFDEINDHGLLAKWVLGLVGSDQAQRLVIESLLERIDFLVSTEDKNILPEYIVEENILLREDTLVMLVRIVVDERYDHLRDLVPGRLTQIILSTSGSPVLNPLRLFNDDNERLSMVQTLMRLSQNIKSENPALSKETINIALWLKYGRWPSISVSAITMAKFLIYFVLLVFVILAWFPFALLNLFANFYRSQTHLERIIHSIMQRLAIEASIFSMGSIFWPWPWWWPILCIQGPVPVIEKPQIILNAALPNNAAGETEGYILNNDVKWSVCRRSNREWIPIVNTITARGTISIVNWPGPHFGQSNQPNRNTPDPRPPGKGGNIDFSNYKKAVLEMGRYGENGLNMGTTWHSEKATLAHEMAHWKIDWIETSVKGKIPEFLAATGRLSVGADTEQEAIDALMPSMTLQIAAYTLSVTQEFARIKAAHRPGDQGAGYKAGQKYLDKIIEKIKTIAQDSNWPWPP